MQSRPRTELDDMAERIADVMQSHATSIKWTPDMVDLRLVSDLFWALGLEPDFKLILKEKGA